MLNWVSRLTSEGRMDGVTREIERAKRKPMRFELGQAPTPGSVGQVSDLLLRLLLFATVAWSGWAAIASGVGDDARLEQQHPATAQGQAAKNYAPKPHK